MNFQNLDSQLVLDLGHRPALEREDFLIAPCNNEAVSQVDKWPSWTSHLLILVGNPGSGKTHLASVWRAMSDATIISSKDLNRDHNPWRLLRPVSACVVEDVSEKIDDQALLHLINVATEVGGFLLITSIKAPSKWPIKLADLESRVRAAPIATLHEPDDNLLAAIMVKLFADRQLSVAPEVIGYLVTRIDRSFDAARSIVEELDRTALSQARSVTIPLAREVLIKLNN